MLIMNALRLVARAKAYTECKEAIDIPIDIGRRERNSASPKSGALYRNCLPSALLRSSQGQGFGETMLVGAAWDRHGKL